MKISELAKDLNITSKEVIKILQDNGYDYKSPQKILADTEADLVRKNVSSAGTPAEKAEKKAAPAAEKEAAPKAKEAASKKEEIAKEAVSKKEEAVKEAAPKKEAEAPKAVFS